MNGRVTKIYELRTLGYDQLVKEQETIIVNFKQIAKAKRDAAKEAADAAKAQGVESEAYKKAAAALDAEKVKLIELRAEQKRLTSEKLAVNNARQAEINQQKQATQANNVEAGSIAAYRREMNELNKAILNRSAGGQINFRNQIISYDQAIAKLRQLIAADQDYRRQSTKDGTLVGEYTSGIVKAFKQMGLGDLIGGQVSQANARLTTLNASFNNLKSQLQQVRTTGQGSLETIERLLLENRREALALEQQVGHLKKELRGAGDVGNQITSGIASGFRDMKNQLAQFVLGYIGFQALLSGSQKLLHQNYELSDSISQIKIYTKETTGEVDKLVDSLKQLDTRTSLGGLVDIAKIVAKKGVVKEEITGVTQALDQLFVVLGKEVGDPHEAIASMVKLVNVYSEDKHITAKNIGDIGAAIAKLTSSGVATGRFLIDFSERMAGVRGITGITIDKVLGLGAALQELGQRTEVSATALSQLIVKLFVNTDKYAAIVGKTKEEFSAMLRESPIDAFVLVAEKLKGNAGEMEKFFEGVTDLHVRGARVIGVLGDIAGNADYARKRIADATKALGDQAALTSAFTEKNTNFASTIDKISKKFEVLGANKSVQVTLTAIASIITFLLGNIPGLLIVLGLWTTGWAILNKELFFARANLLLVNVQLIAGRIALAAVTIVTNAYAIAVALLSGAYRGATIAATLFNRVILLTPLGIILTLVGLTAGAFAAFAGVVTGTSAKIVDHAERLKLLMDVQNRVREQTAATANKIALLTSVVKDGNLSLSSREKALKDLIAIAPEYLDKLTLENIKTSEGKAILDGYIVSLQKKAELQAGESIANKAIEERTRLEKTLYDLEIKRKQGKLGKNDLSDEEKQYLSFTRRNIPFAAAIASDFGTSTVDAAIQGVKDEIEKKNKEIDQANGFVKEKYEQLGKNVKEGDKKVENAATTEPIRTPTYVKGLIDALNKQLDETEIGSKLAAELKAKRDKLQEEYDSATKKDKDSSSKGSRLSGAQRDNLRDEDATRETLLAEQKISFARGLQSEEDYLKNTLKINQDAINKKLALIKGNNAAERKLRADLQLELANDEKDTNEKLFKIEEDRLKDQLDNVKKNADLTAKAITDNPVATDTEKAQAKLDADKTILQAQEAFNSSMDDLEQKYGDKSKKNAEERATAIKQVNADLNKDQQALSKASISDLEKNSEAEISVYKSVIAKQRAAIATNSKYSFAQKEILTGKLDKAENIGILAREVKSAEAALPIFKKQLDEKLISEKEYTDALEKYYQKIQKLQQATTEASKTQIKDLTNAVKEALSTLFGLTEQQTDSVFSALSASFSLAKEAMNGYYDNEQSRIKQSLDASNERLDAEKKKALSFAGSKAEEERIEKQYASKKKQAEKQAGNELKAIKKKEARLALATELANIAAAAAANVLNGVSFGAAGAIQLAVQSALAIGRYAIRTNMIDSTQFEFGGSPDDVPRRGGQFGGKPHSQGGTPFMYKNRSYEAEVGELAIVRTKNAPTGNYTISGTHMQIASKLNQLGGGVPFALGGSLKKFEYGGGLGQSLQAPVFTPSAGNTVINYNNGVQEKAFETLNEHAKAIQAVSDRVDRIQVIQVTSSVTNAQKKEVKQQSIGTL